MTLNPKNKAELLEVISRKITNYQEAKIQSEEIDLFLGFNIADIEQKLIKNKIEEQDKKKWTGLDPQIFQTPYSELINFINLINPKETDTWVDLGAAYGRMGIVLFLLKPDMKFIGYEIVNERVLEANKVYQNWDMKNSSLIQDDIALNQFTIPLANLYFIYDFGSKNDIYYVLEKLRIISKSQKIKIIARGRGIRQWIMLDFPWLYAEHDPIHLEHISIFTT